MDGSVHDDQGKNDVSESLELQITNAIASRGGNAFSTGCRYGTEDASYGDGACGFAFVTFFSRRTELRRCHADPRGDFDIGQQ